MEFQTINEDVITARIERANRLAARAERVNQKFKHYEDLLMHQEAEESEVRNALERSQEMTQMATEDVTQELDDMQSMAIDAPFEAGLIEENELAEEDNLSFSEDDLDLDSILDGISFDNDSLGLGS